MKRKIKLLVLLSGLLVLASIRSFAQLPNTWTQKADFGGSARYGATSLSIGTKGYLCAGYNNSGRKKDFWEYDPTTDTWSQKADFGGTARVFASGFSIGNKGFIGCGDDGSLKNDVWEYDPALNIWTEKANFGGLGRQGAVSFSIGSKGYIGTGLVDLTTRVNDFWEYDPAIDTWIQKSNVGGPVRAYAVGFSIGSKGFAGTGNSGGLENDFWEYNPSSDTWIQKANFGGMARFGAVSFAIGSNGYIGLGDLGAGYSNDFWEYNPALNVWVQAANFGGSSRTSSTGFCIGNKGFVGTGSDGINANEFKDFWEYNPTCIPAAINSEPVNQSVLYGSAASFTTSATNAVSFQWQEDTGSGFIDIVDAGIYSNATTSTLNISVPTVSMSGFKYRCIVTGNCSPQAITNGNATLTVDPISILISPNAGQTKVYGSSDPTPFNYSYAPALLGSDVITGLMGRIPGENVGTYAFTIGTLNAGTNYSLTIATTSSFSITPLSIVIIPNTGQAKIYGSIDPSPFTYSLSPALAGSDVITGLMARVAGENVGSYNFTIGTLSAGSNYALSLAASPAFNITQLDIVVTASSSQTKEYGSADPVFTFTSSPALLGGDAFTGALSRVTGENVGLYAITQGTLSAGSNYAITFISKDFNITSKQILITAIAGQEKVYGSAEPTSFSYTYAPSLVGSDMITGILNRVAGENVGNYAYTLGTLTAGPNYILSIASAPTFGITPRNLTVTAEDKGKCYDGAIFSGAYTVNFSGFVNGEDQGVLGSLLIFGGTAITAVIPGSYSIIPSGLTSTNYAITYVNGTLVIDSAPTPTISGINSLCAGSTDVLYTTEPGFSNYVWTISYGGVITGGLNTNQVTVDWATAGSRTISVNYGNASGCFALSQTTFDVSVLPVPVPIISGENSVCSGTIGKVYTTQINYSNYIWNISAGGSITSGAGTHSITVNWTGSGYQTISVDFTNDLGCSSLEPTIYNVDLAPIPAASDPITGSVSVCAGTDGVDYSVSPISNAVTYEWTLPTGATIITGAGTSSITVDFALNATSGIITVQGVNDCGSGLSSPDFNIQVNPIPVTPVITQHGDTLISSSVTGNQWYLDGMAINGAVGQEHIAVYIGSYHVEVTLSECVSAPSNSILVLPVSTEEALVAEVFDLYPNPATGSFSLNIKTNGNGPFNLEIYNNLGAVVWKQNVLSASGTFITKIDIDGMPAGIYTVALRSKSSTIFKKLVVKR